MSELPEGRQPLTWKDMPFAARPKGHPSTERLEIEKLRERIAELEAALRRISLGEQNSGTTKRDLGIEARAALNTQENKT